MPEQPRATVIVLAKEPVPGRVKTRLTTRYTPSQAAELAAAALQDTLETACMLHGVRVVLALDGGPGSYRGEIVAQRGDGLDERLAAAFDDASLDGVPTLLIGMDTPQVTVSLLEGALEQLAGADAVLGHADDGGWWALGLQRPDAALLVGVPMSSAVTGRCQEERLRSRGLSLRLLPSLLDVDTPEDALAVAALASHTRFARLLASYCMAGAA